jgi:hypothetical protein
MLSGPQRGVLGVTRPARRAICRGMTQSPDILVSPTRAWRPWLLLACALSLFACVTVNYWIYNVHGWFLALKPEGWPIPPTISRAASLPEIAVPFSVWITLSGIGLALAVAIIGLSYLRLLRRVPTAPIWLQVLMYLAAPAAILLQAASALGMNWLSVNTLLNNPPMHMLGSVLFFASQALVILIYGGVNLALLRQRSYLADLARAGWLNPTLVAWRARIAALAVALAFTYGVLFVLKDVYVYPQVKWVHQSYVMLEPIVISSYLIVVLLACLDKLRGPAT